MSSSWRAAWERGQRGWPERYPLVQFPNAPLIAYLVASLLHAITGAGVFAVIAFLGLVVWALLELVAGDNAFRRGLGAVVLVITVAGTVAG